MQIQPDKAEKEPEEKKPALEDVRDAKTGATEQEG